MGDLLAALAFGAMAAFTLLMGVKTGVESWQNRGGGKYRPGGGR